MFFIRFMLFLNVLNSIYCSCPILGTFHLSAQFTINQTTDSNSACFEYFFGSIFKKQLITVVFADNLINCDSDRLTILDGNRKVLYDYCENALVATSKDQRFSIEDYYLILQVNMSTNSRLISVINLFVIDFDKPPNPILTSKSTSKTTTKVYNQTEYRCGVPSFNPISRIIGGIEAVPNSWPWQVYLTDGNKFCGGALLNDEWILTASHCVVSSYWTAYLGYHDIRLISKIKGIRISKIFKHPDYNTTTKKNDLALFKLKSKTNFSNSIVPICLPKSFLFDKHKIFTVIGWGKISNTGLFSSQLQQANVKIKANSECQFYNLDKTQICAGITNEDDVKDSCQGDSGSPLFATNGAVYYLTGIVSFGRSICDGFGVYTNVYEYLDWINDIMKKN